MGEYLIISAIFISEMKKISFKYLFALGAGVIMVIMACDNSSPDATLSSPTLSSQTNTSEWDSLINIVNRSSDRNRYVWQKPDLVLDYLGKIDGKTIADIGAGSGYFTLLIPQRGAKVIAIDIDPNALKGIDETMHLPNYPAELREKIELRQVEEDDPKLGVDEVDVVMIINTITYIQDRPDYLSKVMQGIKSGGKILIVDYKTRRIPLNIPRDQRLPLYQIEEELYQAGFTNIIADDCSLSYQYLIIAEKV